MSKTKKAERPSFSGPMEQLPEDPSSPCYLVLLIFIFWKKIKKFLELYFSTFYGCICSDTDIILSKWFQL